MIFPAEDVIANRPRPTPLYTAAASVSETNLWTSVNGWSTPRVYSGVEEEYNHAKSETVIADFGPLSRYTVHGKDASLFLTKVASVPTETLGVGESARGLILDDAGGVLNLAEVARLSDELYILTTPSPQARQLSLCAQGLEVDYSLTNDSVAAIAILGPGAYDALRAVGMKMLGQDIAASAVMRGVETAARPIHFGSLPGVELIFPGDEALTIWERLMRRRSIRPIGLDALEVLRIESGSPRPGVDFSTRKGRGGDRRKTPAEIGLPHLAPLNSGWFNGRRALRYTPPLIEIMLTAIYVDADRAPVGASILSNGKVVGAITSSAYSPVRKSAIAFCTLPVGSVGKPLEMVNVDGSAHEGVSVGYLDTLEGRLANAFQEEERSATDS